MKALIFGAFFMLSITQIEQFFSKSLGATNKNCKQFVIFSNVGDNSNIGVIIIH